MLLPYILQKFLTLKEATTTKVVGGLPSPKKLLYTTKNRLLRMKKSIKERLQRLRQAMAANRVDAVILPANDPHQSEYVADCWKVREYFSGFTGSAGLLIVLADYAALFTDSRYFLQAEQELDGTSITLHKMGPQQPEHVAWLVDRLGEGMTIGVEAPMFSIREVQRIQGVAASKNILLKPLEAMITKIWNNRPKLPETVAYDYGIEYAGHSREEKLATIRAFMERNNVQYYFIAALDEIAWLLNIRAWDVDYTPVVISYLLVGQESATLFVRDYKIKKDLQDKLKAAGVIIKDYYAAGQALSILPKKDRLYVDQDNFSWAFQRHVQVQLVARSSVITPLKAVKNSIEVEHFRKVMVKDGVALLRLFRWLEKTLGERGVKETEVAEQLTKFRAEQPLYKGDSFGAIVGYNGNGAIVHYRAEEATCATIENDGMLLLDSGGQYLDGTTDITRTVHFGEPTKDQKRHYTLVLKGNIALQQAHFPTGTTGAQLDTLARAPLWSHGFNFGHGTGHGVGFFLGVHEGPQGFAPYPQIVRGKTAHKAYTVSSNEPGHYETGKYGIRIENLMLCVPSDKNPNFLAFEVLTLFPIATNLLDRSLMTSEEVKWLNQYHQKVYAALAPELKEAERAWLWNRCAAV